MDINIEFISEYPPLHMIYLFSVSPDHNRVQFTSILWWMNKWWSHVTLSRPTYLTNIAPQP